MSKYNMKIKRVIGAIANRIRMQCAYRNAYYENIAMHHPYVVFYGYF